MGQVDQLRWKIVGSQDFSKGRKIFARADHPFQKPIFLTELQTYIVGSSLQDIGIFVRKKSGYTSCFDRVRRLPCRYLVKNGSDFVLPLINPFAVNAGCIRSAVIDQRDDGIDSAQVITVMQDPLVGGVLTVNRLPKTYIFLQARVFGKERRGGGLYRYKGEKGNKEQ